MNDETSKNQNLEDVIVNITRTLEFDIKELIPIGNNGFKFNVGTLIGALICQNRDPIFLNKAQSILENQNSIRDFISQPDYTSAIPPLDIISRYINYARKHFRYGNVYINCLYADKFYPRINNYSQSELPVLIIGDSGTGKELTAKTIHHNSSRRNKPFVSLNCSTLPENLLQSKLFRNKEGAVAGGEKETIGLIEHADGGTIFLDDIVEISNGAQIELLQLIDEKGDSEFESTKIQKPNCRIICATNKDISDRKVREKYGVRDDLFYRISGTTINLPALDYNRIEIPFLIYYFICDYLKKTKGNLRQNIFIPFQLIKFWLTLKSWPGNYPQLRYKIESYVSNYLNSPENESSFGEWYFEFPFGSKDNRMVLNRMNKDDSRWVRLIELVDDIEFDTSPINQTIIADIIDLKDILKFNAMFYINQPSDMISDFKYSDYSVTTTFRFQTRGKAPLSKEEGFSDSSTGSDPLGIEQQTGADRVHSQSDVIEESHNIWRKEGDIWLVVYEGNSVMLPHTTGMYYIGHLLANPNKNFSLKKLDLLVNSGEVALSPLSIKLKRILDIENTGSSSSENSGDVFKNLGNLNIKDFGWEGDDSVDKKTIDECNNRIRELKKKLEIAKLTGNDSLEQEVCDEIYAIVDHLRASTNISGQPRKIDSDLERIRKKIDSNIRYSYDKIRKKHESLIDHLGKSIKLGRNPRYIPNSDIKWDTNF